MSWPLVLYLFIYIGWSFLCMTWFFWTLRIHRTLLVIWSFVATIVATSLLACFYTAAVYFSIPSQIALVGALATLALMSILFRRLLKKSVDIPEPPITNMTKSATWFATILLLLTALRQMALQAVFPRPGWDELVGWIPRMQVLYEGNFSDLFAFALGTYPPLWPAWGSLAFFVDTTFLYLLPFLMATHAMLAIIWYLRMKNAGLGIFFFAFLFPAWWGFWDAILAQFLYSHVLFTALLLSFYISAEIVSTPKRGKFLQMLLLFFITLVRPDGIASALILLFVWAASYKLRGVKKRAWIFLWGIAAFIFLGHGLWMKIRLQYGVIDPIFAFFREGTTAILDGSRPIYPKLRAVAEYTFKQFWLTGPFWMFWLLGFGMLFRKHWNRWTFALILWTLYTLAIYVSVPETTAGIDWWLGTGFTRILGQYLIIPMIEMCLIFDSLVRDALQPYEKK